MQRGPQEIRKCQNLHKEVLIVRIYKIIGLLPEEWIILKICNLIPTIVNISQSLHFDPTRVDISQIFSEFAVLLFKNEFYIVLPWICSLAVLEWA